MDTTTPRVVRLPQIADTAELPLDATRFAHDRALPPVPPVRRPADEDPADEGPATVALDRGSFLAQLEAALRLDGYGR